MLARYTLALLGAVLALPCPAALAQEDASSAKAIIAVVGDADRFTIGQEGYCGTRTEIDSPSGKQFRVPSNKESFIYIQTRIRVQTVTVTCEGDYSFTPSPGLLHIIRYSMEAKRCRLEMFQSEPGGIPQPMHFKREESRSCLFK